MRAVFKSPKRGRGAADFQLVRHFQVTFELAFNYHVARNDVSVHSGFGPDGEPATGHVNVPFHFSVNVEVFSTFNVAGDAY